MAKPQLLFLIITLFAVAGVRGWRGKGSRTPHLTAVTPAVIHGEGPHYDEEANALYFVDIMGNYVNKYDLTSGLTTRVKLPTNVTLVIPVEGCDNDFVVSIGRQLSILTWDGKSRTYGLTEITAVEADKKYNRFNDGKADSRGRLWAGTMGREIAVGVVEKYEGTLYKLEADSNDAEGVLFNVSISNGIAWTKDETTMYYIDSYTYSVAAFDFDAATGTIGAATRNIVYQMDSTGASGMPDGMTIDNEGNLWIAVFNGGRVLNVDPRTGRLLREVRMPAHRVTSVAWGGPDFADLYVTTSRMGLTQEELQQQPLAGCVIRVSGLGVSGRPANRVHRPQCK